MNLNTQNIKGFFFIHLFALGLNSYSQDTAYTFIGFGTEPFSHSAEEKDQQFFDTAAYLINSEPTLQNHEAYYLLACSLWELNKIDDSKKMFLKIIGSTQAYYADTYYHSSDIPGDTTINTYGYGSFTSNYKNSAGIYLTQIYIEQKKFDSAYAYLNDAVNKYKVTFTCGTGYHWQQDNYRYLYGLCFEGLGKEKELFDLLLPYCFDWRNEIVIRAIKRKYSKAEIEKYLTDAVNSIKCKVDKKQSSSFITSNYRQKNEKTKEIKYYSGTGTINLFGKIIDLPTPDLENGQRLTRQYYVKLFKESSFYSGLDNFD
jgi:hypothetical protein